MASINETGHARNVGNFEELIGFCKGYGIAYNPSKSAIKIDGLTSLLTQAQGSLAALKAAKTIYDNATNAREVAFAPLKKLSTKIVNALAAVGANQQTIDDATTSHAKVQGRRMSPKKVAVPAKEGAAATDPTNNSVSQQSYDGQVENFAKLVQTVSAEPLYQPNEVELQPASLSTLLTNLRTLNTEVITTTTALSNARIARDKTLYNKDTGLRDVALAVKQYALSVFGKTSAQYKQVSGILFTGLRS
jgi:hypothetical protein